MTGVDQDEDAFLMLTMRREVLRGWSIMPHEYGGIGLFHSCLIGEPVKRFNAADLRAILAFVERHHCSPLHSEVRERKA